MISKSGYVCAMRSQLVTRFFGTRNSGVLPVQNLVTNGLNLFDSLTATTASCRYLKEYFGSLADEIYPLWFNFRIAESEEDLLYLKLQKTMIIIGLSQPLTDPAPLNLVDCTLLGRHVPQAIPVTDNLAELETNGLRTFADFEWARRAHREYQRQTQTKAVLSSFWAKPPNLSAQLP